jgi:hypothetical protein
MQDVNHWYSGDTLLSVTGDLSVSSPIVSTQQRIIRRILTNPVSKDGPPDYIFAPNYGCGAAKYIGETINKLKELQKTILNQVILEPGVSTNPFPKVVLNTDNTVLFIKIMYVDITTGELQNVAVKVTSIDSVVDIDMLNDFDKLI